MARTRLGWLMALFFGLQSMQAYADLRLVRRALPRRRLLGHDAGLLLGVITGISIPLSFVVPALVARMHNQTLLMWVLMACYPVGYLGLILAPRAGAVGVGAARRRRHDAPSR